jgi:transcriptional regulator with XRE-family HTH domain
MDLIKIGLQIKENRVSKGISLNKMSKDLYNNRYRVNHLSEIEKGNVDLRFSQAIKILNYLKIKTVKL